MFKPTLEWVEGSLAETRMVPLRKDWDETMRVFCFTDILHQSYCVP